MALLVPRRTHGTLVANLPAAAADIGVAFGVTEIAALSDILGVSAATATAATATAVAVSARAPTVVVVAAEAAPVVVAAEAAAPVVIVAAVAAAPVVVLAIEATAAGTAGPVVLVLVSHRILLSRAAA